MTINRIKSMQDCGVFRDFAWPGNLPEFGRYNLIYGWNGSGKTTLSRLFRSLCDEMPLVEGGATLTVNNHDVEISEFFDPNLPIRVFDRDFIQENVLSTEGEVDLIFFLGKVNVEGQREVERLKKVEERQISQINKAREKQYNAEKNFENFCKDQARFIKLTLRSEGNTRYSNYNRAHFIKRADDMLAAGDVDSRRLDENARNELLDRHRARPKDRFEPINYLFPDFNKISEETSDLLLTTVMSSVIKALKEDAVLASWVHQGLKHHRDRDAESCLFCTQPLPGDRIEKLEAHFSAEYDALLEKIEQGLISIQDATNETQLQLPVSEQLHNELAVRYEKAKTKVEEQLLEARQSLDTLKEALLKKQARPLDEIRLDRPVGQPDFSAVDAIKGIIEEHNRACGNLQERIDSARMRLEDDSVSSALDRFVELRNTIRTSEEEVDAINNELERTKSKIAHLEQEIVDHRRPAEELNKELRNYLGHSEIYFETKESGYAIMRGDDVAETLSEGETTAIALLYFLKSLQDQKGADLSKTVVVLDDPVSSLDANALYSAFGFIRGRTKDAEQLFILTHNFTFFRQVKNWFHHIKGQKQKEIEKRPARFYMLDCIQEDSERRAELRRLDPLLEEFESEYYYLFSRIYKIAKSPSSPSLEDSYVLPNLSRRVLEAFLAFRQPELSGELYHQLQSLQTSNDAKKDRILRFVHTYSHSISVNEPGHDPSLLGESKKVLQDLLDLMKDEDPGHFSAMEKMVQERFSD